MTLTKTEEWEMQRNCWEAQPNIWICSTYCTADLLCRKHKTSTDKLERLDNGFFKLDLRHASRDDAD